MFTAELHLELETISITTLELLKPIVTYYMFQLRCEFRNSIIVSPKYLQPFRSPRISIGRILSILS